MTRSTRTTTGLAILACIIIAICGSKATAADAPKDPAGTAAKPAQTAFTLVTPLPPPKIVEASTTYLVGAFDATNITDGNIRSEYSSDGKEKNTFIEFDFGDIVTVAAFRHVDRNDPATIASSKLVFSDNQGKTVATSEVTHANKPGGITHHVLASPVAARRVRWSVTGLGVAKYGTVGGAEIRFFKVSSIDPAPTAIKLSARSVPALEKKGASSVRPLHLTLDYPYAEPTGAVLRVSGTDPIPLSLSFGSRDLDISIPAVAEATTLKAAIEIAGKVVAQQDLPLKPVRQSIIYILPHSHVDIGYTELQTAVERKQMSNIARGIELAKATAGYPEGSRYKWNTEVLWAVDSYLRQSTPEKQQEFIDAVHKGQVGLDGMYGNELTGLCRPEELLRLFSYATRLADRCGVPVETAMISDVPGYTWGTVSAMAQCGIKYWSIGPNYIDRIGYTLAKWENKPFYWVGPSGRDKVLCWIPYQGYAISHILRSDLTREFLFKLMLHLDSTAYPYDLIHLRWSGHGDNAVPDEKIPDFVKNWNEQYDSPRLVIATTAEAFRAFEQRYGDKLPSFKGDWTPYWEDGAGSSARETAINRASAEKLVQAETLWAMLSPRQFPVAEFQDAWRNVLLYSEHTWGAHNSVTEPDVPFVKDQWKIKQAFALDAEKQSDELTRKAFDNLADKPATAAIDVYNTTCWTRTDLVTIPKSLSQTGDAVTDFDGKPVASQRLSTGELAILAKDIPPFVARRYTLSAGKPVANGDAHAKDLTITNGLLSVKLDGKTGAIVELKAEGIDANLVKADSIALNDYFYMVGDDAANPLRSGPAKITVKESGPLVASLMAESDAPGCNKLFKEVRLVAGLDRVEIIDTVDKKRAAVKGKAGDWTHAAREAKEGVHFGFAFNVPDGVMRMDIPWAVARPEADQLPGACKNWFTVQRWVDVSNDRYGVTWATLDAPLVEVGALTANLLGSQRNPETWINHLDPTQTLYSWAMNNHWHTNYRAYQEGPTVFRYAIQPHGSYASDTAARFGTSLSQPLVAVAARGSIPTEPRLQVDPPSVMVTAFKPSDDGKAFVVRLFGASEQDMKATIRWSDPKPKTMWLSNLSEKPLRKIEGPIEVPASGIVTLRVE